MHSRSPAKRPDVCRDPPAREVSLIAARRAKTSGVLPDLPMSGRPLIQVMYVIDRTM
jgi:hypothetical protein